MSEHVLLTPKEAVNKSTEIGIVRDSSKFSIYSQFSILEALHVNTFVGSDKNTKSMFLKDVIDLISLCKEKFYTIFIPSVAMFTLSEINILKHYFYDVDESLQITFVKEHITLWGDDLRRNYFPSELVRVIHFNEEINNEVLPNFQRWLYFDINNAEEPDWNIDKVEQSLPADIIIHLDPSYRDIMEKAFRYKPDMISTNDFLTELLFNGAYNLIYEEDDN